MTAETNLRNAAVRCFNSADGRLLIDHLKRLTLLRRLAPSAPESELRHLEGQRALVIHLISLIDAPAAAEAYIGDLTHD